MHIRTRRYRCIPIRRQGAPIDIFYMMMRIQETIYSEIVKGNIMEKRPVLIKKYARGGSIDLHHLHTFNLLIFGKSFLCDSSGCMFVC